MLTKLGQSGYAVQEEPAECSTSMIDSDSDTDSDPEKNNNIAERQLGAAADGCRRS